MSEKLLKRKDVADKILTYLLTYLLGLGHRRLIAISIGPAFRGAEN